MKEWLKCACKPIISFWTWSLCICICTCMCVLSLLAGSLTLLKLLFYVHQLIVRVAGFQKCCFYSFPPLKCQLHFVPQKAFWRAVLWLLSLELQLAFWSSSKIPVSSIWKGGGKNRWKRCFDECVPYFSCLSGWKGYLKSGLGGKTWKDTSPKPNTDFLHERGHVGETSHIRSWPIQSFLWLRPIIEVNFKNP